ncbi:MAG: Asp-tRNA(Asn)/Glu-tRNA(Gln) amidotransferase subunit GatA [Calditrichaeota bacterium]|nr:MAG: Asp-tRNA(Asn)/Glu-tRNA(Gln) amidotransferase subunit GatA [Calditrichota bacterium]
MENFSIRSVQKKIKNGELHLKSIVGEFIGRIEQRDDLNAFLAVYKNAALAKAEEINNKIRSGNAGSLAGAVIAVKDNMAFKGGQLSCASKILENFVSPYDSTVAKKLTAADAIIIGKTNMDEFAMGSSGENSSVKPAKNPHNTSHVPGGSSSGSAVAVAANMCTAALGSDTGGSIRQPAAFCGIYGMKPTYGRISRYGLVAFASSLDQIGPLANSIDDLAVILQAISGNDVHDSTSAPEPVPEFSSRFSESIEGKTVGIPRQYMTEALQPEIADAINSTKAKLIAGGVKVVDVELKMLDYCIAAYYIICTAEASSNLSRYDGVRYGFRAENAKELDEMYTQTRVQGFGKEVKRRIMLGTYVLSAGYYDAYYRRALKARTLIRQDFENAFKQCDLMLSPTTPTTAFKLGENINDPLTMYLQDIYTVSLNLAGLPGLSIPAGRDSAALPIGLQLIGKPFDELSLLQTGYFLENTPDN